MIEHMKNLGVGLILAAVIGVVCFIIYYLGNYYAIESAIAVTISAFLWVCWAAGRAYRHD